MKLNFTYKKWHSLLLLLFIFGFSSQANAISPLTFWVKSGLTGSAVSPLAWNTAGNWTTTSNGSAVAATRIPQAGDTVNILVGKYVSIPAGVTGTCATLNVIGTTANLYIQGTSLLNCDALNINTGGNITMMALSPSTNIITCTGTINCGDPSLTTAAGKGTLTVNPGSAVSCGKLFLGAGTSTNASSIVGKLNSATFTFTGNGTDVIPATTVGVNPTTPVFGSVIFDPKVGNTITIPSGFCAKVMSIASGTVDFSNNYSTIYTATSGSISMSANTTLRIGGNNVMPNMASYIFDNTSTVNFNGSAQSIRGLLSGYKNLTLSGSGLKSLDGSVEIGLTLSVADGTILDLAGHDLTISGNYVNGTYPGGVYTKGTGCVRSSSASNIWYRGYSSSLIQFDQTTPGTTNVVNNLTLGDLPANLGATTPTDINPLNLTIESPLNIIGTANFIAGHIVSNGNVTFKSDASKTAFVGPITDLTYCGIIGNVNIERWVPAGTDNGTASNLGRGYRALSPSVTGGTIFSNWQEGGTTASFSGSILGNTLTTTANLAILGKHISGTNIPANTTITDVSNAASGVYGITQPIQSMGAKTYATFANLTSSTAVANFTGSITSNVLTVTAFNSGAGLLASGQKISGGLLTNTVIISQLTGTTGNTGTYSIGIEIPSETIFYNGALAGFGTQISGKACTDAQLGQVDATTGVDLTRSGNPSLFSFNNTLQQWTAITNTKTQNITAGNPYLLMVRGDRTIDLALNSSTPTNTTLRSTGTIVAGDQDVSSSLNTTTASLNYIGNPYQAPVDLMGMWAAGGVMVGLEQSYTVFDTTQNTRGAYVTVDLTDGSSTVPGSAVSGTVQPNQAFFVRTADNSVSGDTPTFIFQESYKLTTDNAYVPVYRKAQSTTSKINGAIYNTTDSTKALDGFSLSFSDNYTNKILAEDAIKPTGNQDEIFASVNGATNMAIDKRSFPAANDEIALNLTQERLSNYILKFTVANFDAKNAYLVDTYTAKETPLTNSTTSSYAFSVDTAIPASTAANRFKIVFRTATPLNTISNSINKFTVYPNPVIDNKFTVKANQDFNGKTANLSIVNTLGQSVYSLNSTFSNDGSIAVNPTYPLTKGVYILKITVDGKVETKKLIIK